MKRGYYDVDFFDQDYKTRHRKGHGLPVVLTNFSLSTKKLASFGLDALRSEQSWKNAPRIYWTAHAVIRTLDWLSEWGRGVLLQDLRMSENSLKLYVGRGQVEVLLRGRLIHIPQYLNSLSLLHLPLLSSYYHLYLARC